MKTRLIPLSIALAAALLTPSAPLEAATLGQLRSVSALGASFRAEIALVGGAADASCFRVVKPRSSSGDIPALGDGRISVVGSGANARVVVRNDRRINDPIIRLAIENLCDARLLREYTLLMPFAGAPEASVSPPRAQTSRPAATPSRERARPAPARPAAAATPGRTWHTAAGESLDTIAASLYPDNPAARQRFADTTARANPELFPDRSARARALPAGTPVVVPDLRTVANSVPAAQPVATASPRKQAAARRATGDRLVVDKGDPPATTTSPGAAKGDEPQDLRSREQALAEAIDRSIIAEMQLLARIKELEEIQARLEARIRASLEAAEAAEAAAAKPAPTPAVAAPAPAVQAPVVGSPPVTVIGASDDLYLFGGLGVASLLLALALLRGRRRTVAPVAEAAVRSPENGHGAAPREGGTARSGRVRAEDRLFAAPAPITITGASPAASPSAPAAALKAEQGDQVVVEEHKSAVELAEIMMSFGRVKGAADTLAEFIRGNPRDAVTPWLKLLEVYRTAGLRKEFETIAGELNRTFNVTTVRWDNYEALRDSRLSIEDLPHISETIQHSWGTSVCQRYLQHLLRDNRDGTRNGLPFTVVDEILTLAAVLEDQLGPYRSAVQQNARPAEALPG